MESLGLVLQSRGAGFAAVENLSVLFDAVYEAARYPVTTYPGMRRFVCLRGGAGGAGSAGGEMGVVEGSLAETHECGRMNILNILGNMTVGNPSCDAAIPAAPFGLVPNP